MIYKNLYLFIIYNIIYFIFFLLLFRLALSSWSISALSSLPPNFPKRNEEKLQKWRLNELDFNLLPLWVVSPIPKRPIVIAKSSSWLLISWEKASSLMQFRKFRGRGGPGRRVGPLCSHNLIFLLQLFTKNVPSLLLTINSGIVLDEKLHRNVSKFDVPIYFQKRILPNM